VIALIMAFNKNETVLAAVRYAWAGLGCAFGPLMLTSLYSNYVNKYGAMAGILTGGIIAAIWESYSVQLTGHAIPSEVPAFTISLLSIYGVTLLTKKL
jgi:Na+/proline symporter